MKIDLITPHAHQERTMKWYAQAANDPAVHRWYSSGSWLPAPLAHDDDWTSAYYMDDTNTGLMSLSLDRAQHTCGVGLWVLGADTAVASGMMRYFLRVLVKRYGLSAVAFCIAETNTAWIEKMNAVAGAYCWGVEPRGLFDPELGAWVNAHRFKIPITDKLGLRDLLRAHARTKRDIEALWREHGPLTLPRGV